MTASWILYYYLLLPLPVWQYVDDSIIIMIQFESSNNNKAQWALKNIINIRIHIALFLEIKKNTKVAWI